MNELLHLSRFGSWRVTTWGLENARAGYDIPAADLFDDDWLNHMSRKPWVNMRDFAPALVAARRYHAAKQGPDAEGAPV